MSSCNVLPQTKEFIHLASKRVQIAKRLESYKDLRVALISPQVIGSKNQVRKATPPLGIAFLAAELIKRGVSQVKLVDCAVEDYDNVQPLADDPNFIIYGLDNESLIRRLREFEPHVVGISSLFSSQTECAFSAAQAIRDAFGDDMLIVMGGNHASFRAESILSEQSSIDFILAGEADVTFANFVTDYFEGRDFYETPGLVWRDGSTICMNPKASFILDLDLLGFPAFELYPMERYFEIDMPHNPFTKSGRVGTVMTSRGCPQNCYFCSSPTYSGRRFRVMSSARVIALVDHMVKTWDVQELQILDDTFTSDWKRVIEICEGIGHHKLRITLPNAIRADLPRNHDNRLEMFRAMQEAGVAQFGVGIESGDQEFSGKVIRKHLKLGEVHKTIELAHQVGILVHANFILGFPFETAQNRQNTIDFAKSLDADSFSVSLAGPLPGTDMWDLVERHNLFVDGFNVNRMVFAKVNIKPHDISPTELYTIVDTFNRELNEAAQLKRPEQAKEKYEIFLQKGKAANTRNDRKYHMIENLNYIRQPNKVRVGGE